MPECGNPEESKWKNAPHSNPIPDAYAMQMHRQTRRPISDTGADLGVFKLRL